MIPEWEDEEPLSPRVQPWVVGVALGIALLFLIAYGIAPLLSALNLVDEQPVQPSPSPISRPGGDAPPALTGLPAEAIRTATDVTACLSPPEDAEPFRDSIEPLSLDEGFVTRVGDAVEAIRGLEFETIVEPRFISPEEMRKRITAQVTKPRQVKDLRLLGDILIVLGAIEPGADLVELTKELVGGSILGYYLPNKDELFVRSTSDDESVTPSGAVTLAHEMDHALTDQALPWPVKGHFPERESEEQYAIRSLIEGDAVILQEQFAALTLSPEQNLARFQEESGGANLDAIPHFLLRSLAFPYVEGPAFVCDLHARGGWDLIDVAYSNPPTSTDQVIFPGRLGEEPAGKAPPALGSLGRDWVRRQSSTIGTAELLFLFEAPGGDRSIGWPADIAREYAGALYRGRTAAWTRGRRLAFAISLSQRGDYPRRALCTAIEDWYRATFPDAKEISRAPHEEMALRHDRGSAVLTCEGEVVRLGIGPDPATARSTIR